MKKKNFIRNKSKIEIYNLYQEFEKTFSYLAKKLRNKNFNKTIKKIKCYKLLQVIVLKKIFSAFMLNIIYLMN